ELDVSTSFFFTPHEVAIIGKELYKFLKQKAPNLSIGKIMRIFGDSDKKMTKRIKKNKEKILLSTQKCKILCWCYFYCICLAHLKPSTPL
ncbi:hypothetical protein, partial [Mycoplasmopsis bovis]|uniref:hypothetical protein n=1 Tax=Mycoplasmopsis bovis TaxID=28903 RepID=UPI003BF6DB94